MNENEIIGLFIVMRMLGGIVRKDEGSQRENIFHSRSII